MFAKLLRYFSKNKTPQVSEANVMAMERLKQVIAYVDGHYKEPISLQDIQKTDRPIAEIIEDNGFTNQKLFNKMFKEFYGATPSEVRKNVL